MRAVICLMAILLVVSVAGYAALNVYDDWFPFGRMWQTPAVRPLEEPPLATAAQSVPITGGEAIYLSTAPERLAAPLDLDDPKNVRQGETVYRTYCIHCHGPDHDGYGTVGQSFNPLPGDLQSPRVQSLAAGVLFDEISYGIPNGRQPPLASTITAVDRWQAIAYVRSLGPREP